MKIMENYEIIQNGKIFVTLDDKTRTKHKMVK